MAPRPYACNSPLLQGEVRPHRVAEGFGIHKSNNNNTNINNNSNNKNNNSSRSTNNIVIVVESGFKG